MDDNEGMTFTDMIIISGQRYIDEMEQRIAALEAQNARLLALVREVAQVAPTAGSASAIKHAFWVIGEKARALLAELEGGDNG